MVRDFLRKSPIYTRKEKEKGVYYNQVLLETGMLVLKKEARNTMIQLDLSNMTSFVPGDWFSSRQTALDRARVMLEEGNGPGGDDSIFS